MYAVNSMYSIYNKIIPKALLTLRWVNKTNEAMAIVATLIGLIVRPSKGIYCMQRITSRKNAKFFSVRFLCEKSDEMYLSNEFIYQLFNQN